MTTQIQISVEPIPGETEFCKGCEHHILRGNPKHGSGQYGYFCGYEENLVEVENWAEGTLTKYAQLCTVVNDSGGCMDYSASS